MSANYLFSISYPSLYMTNKFAFLEPILYCKLKYLSELTLISYLKLRTFSEFLRQIFYNFSILYECYVCDISNLNLLFLYLH